MLAQLLDIDVALIGDLRKTNEPHLRISVIDATSVITGLNARESARALRRIFEAHSEVYRELVYYKFPGRRQRNTPVADLATIVEIIFLLPGRTAAHVRYEAAKLVVRYLGGDLGLVDEVQQLAHVQASLREHAPDHPLRAFGEAVEAEPTVQRREARLVLEVYERPELVEIPYKERDLYLMKVVTEDESRSSCATSAATSALWMRCSSWRTRRPRCASVPPTIRFVPSEKAVEAEPVVRRRKAPPGRGNKMPVASMAHGRPCSRALTCCRTRHDQRCFAAPPSRGSGP